MDRQPLIPWSQHWHPECLATACVIIGHYATWTARGGAAAVKRPDPGPVKQVEPLPEPVAAPVWDEPYRRYT